MKETGWGRALGIGRRLAEADDNQAVVNVDLQVEVLSGKQPALVRVRGELDVDSSPTLIVALLPLHDQCVELDLAPVAFMDSTGVRTLLACKEASSQTGGTLRVIDCSTPVGQVLDLIGCREQLTR
ncbi:STAS domain-containing protein [Streptomyces sp. NPDC057445]|uniref:STAS domain-containing protein n=1 Tax=Streptomyces sp. NPDC057445 TaxID=3346136 RepID=UPI0036A632AA